MLPSLLIVVLKARLGGAVAGEAVTLALRGVPAQGQKKRQILL